MIRTMDFQDSNRDGIDDRDQNYDTRMPAFLLTYCDRDWETKTNNNLDLIYLS